MKTNSDHKSTIAKLLATENIHVVHKKTQTASFNVATRELVLPIFKDSISNDLYDMFVCHEVAHALWTPLNMIDKIREQGIDKSVVNVIEDARIEAMIQKKYPGSITNFKKGYKELLDINFFGIKGKDLKELNVIDKINIFFKTGIDVKFTKEEKELSDKVGACKTPEDVLKLAVEIAGYHKQKEEEKEKLSKMVSIGKKDKDSKGEDKESDSSQSDEDDYIDGFEDNEEDDLENDAIEEDQKQESQKSKEQDKSDDDKKEENTTTSSMASGSEGTNNNLKSATDAIQTEMVSQVIDDNARENLYINLPSKIDLNKLVVGHKKVYNDFKTRYWNQKVDSSEKEFKNYLDKEILKVYNDNKKVIQYMVKEFEMKKSADQYKRATTSKTGSLDMNKIHTYKFNDDLFAKMTTIPGATNHGMIMLLDWSGSMAYNMEDTLKQLYNLIWFCQRVKIPYQVLAFSDVYGERTSRWDMPDEKEMVQKPVHNEYNLRNLKLIEFFTSDQTKQESMDMMKYLLGYCEYWVNRNAYNREMNMSPLNIDHTYNLGGTPLDHALMTIPDIQNAFVEKYKVQKSNLVLLTDGDSHSCNDKFELQSDNTWKQDGDTWTDGMTTMTHKKSGKSITKKDMMYHTRTTTYLLQLLKKIIPDMSITGFFIAGSGRAGRVNLRTIESKFRLNHYKSSDHKKIVAIQKELRTNKVAVCKTQGYDEYYILPTGSKNIESEELTIKEGAKTSSIKSAFSKSLKAKTVNRQLLNKFIGMVA